MAACIGTWSFSHSAVLKAQHLLSANASSLDAVEDAIARRFVGDYCTRGVARWHL